MPLILAIEPDRRQASKVAAIVKNRLHAEIVSGDTTEHAVEALAGRVPDLILTSLLLSRKDEAALADWLRESDEAGAHVQSLVIPVLGGALRRLPRRGDGLLSRLARPFERRDGWLRSGDLREQIREYLEHAAEERRHAALRLEDMKEAAAAAAAAEAGSGEPVPTSRQPSAYDSLPAIDTPFGRRRRQPRAGLLRGRSRRAGIDGAAPVGTDSLPESEPADDGEPGRKSPWAAKRPTRVPQTRSGPPTRRRRTTPPASSSRRSRSICSASSRSSASQAAIEAPPAQPRARGDDVLAEFEDALEVIATDDPEPNRPNANSEADSDVLTPLLGATAWPHLDSTVAKVPPGCDRAATEEAARRPAGRRRPRSKKKARTAAPQDEWSRFDPEQCGFADASRQARPDVDDCKPEKSGRLTSFMIRSRATADIGETQKTSRITQRSWPRCVFRLRRAQVLSPVLTPEAHFGFRMGADRQLASADAIERYFEQVAAAVRSRGARRPRARRLKATGTVAAIISAPENIRNLARIRTTNQRLADPRTLPPEDARALAATHKAVVAIGASIHASEIGGTQAANELLHTLATTERVRASSPSCRTSSSS